jgi:hypothetical protein
MDFYKPRQLSIDRTGLGLPLYQEILAQTDSWTKRVVGYAFNEKVVIGWEDFEEWEDPADYELKAIVQEYGYDLLRRLVDSKEMILPFEVELLGEWQGQTWVREKSETSPYGKKSYSKGSFHTLDAGAMAVLGRELFTIKTMKEIREEAEIIPLVVL